jgi:glucosamine 6-phosphate synthetase-like amidotransferase/phosphosugar isomerase protein
LKSGASFEEAGARFGQALHGIFALSIINSDEPDTIIAVREGAPVVVGWATASFSWRRIFRRFCSTRATFFISAKRKSPF